MKKRIIIFLVAPFALLVSCKKENATKNFPIEVSDKATISVPEAPKDSVPADGKYPVISFDKMEHDFGKIKEDQIVSYTFKFENTGEADLLISRAVGSCGCTVPEFPKEPIPPGGKGKIKVSFNPKGKKGDQAKSVAVLCNSKEKMEKVMIKATIEN